MKTKMFVIAVDEYDAAKVEEFLDAMYRDKILAYRPSSVATKLKSIKLLFSYPIDRQGRCMEHQGGDNGSSQDGKRNAPEEGKVPGRRMRR